MKSKVALIALLLLSEVFAQPKYSQNGTASYYAERFVGQKTANGERYRSGEYTAAHRTLPFGTWVRVTNERNGKQVIVRINDRGPYAKNRIIDLSRIAAEDLDMIASGTARVLVELLDSPFIRNNRPDTAYILEKETEKGFTIGHVYDLNENVIRPGNFGIQTGSFSSLSEAMKAISQLQEKGLTEIFIYPASPSGEKVFRVVYGGFALRDDAIVELSKLEEMGFRGFVISYP